MLLKKRENFKKKSVEFILSSLNRQNKSRMQLGNKKYGKIE